MQSGTQKLVFFTMGPMVTTTTMVAALPTMFATMVATTSMVAHVCSSSPYFPPFFDFLPLLVLPPAGTTGGLV